jgi:hypothetical protein
MAAHFFKKAAKVTGIGALGWLTGNLGLTGLACYSKPYDMALISGALVRDLTVDMEDLTQPQRDEINEKTKWIHSRYRYDGHSIHSQYTEESSGFVKIKFHTPTKWSYHMKTNASTCSLPIDCCEHPEDNYADDDDSKKNNE